MTGVCVYVCGGVCMMCVGICDRCVCVGMYIMCVGICDKCVCVCWRVRQLCVCVCVCSEVCVCMCVLACMCIYVSVNDSCVCMFVGVYDTCVFVCLYIFACDDKCINVHILLHRTHMIVRACAHTRTHTYLCI